MFGLHQKFPNANRMWPPGTVASDLPMRKKIDILENCCSGSSWVKKKNSFIVILNAEIIADGDYLSKIDDDPPI